MSGAVAKPDAQPSGDPIGTAQERELINYLCRSTASPEEEQAADALQSRIAEVAELREALRPFAEPHFMGDLYVSFAPRLIEQARAALSQHRKL